MCRREILFVCVAGICFCNATAQGFWALCNVGNRLVALHAAQPHPQPTPQPFSLRCFDAGGRPLWSQTSAALGVVSGLYSLGTHGHSIVLFYYDEATPNSRTHRAMVLDTLGNRIAAYATAQLPGCIDDDDDARLCIEWRLVQVKACTPTSLVLVLESSESQSFESEQVVATFGPHAEATLVPVQPPRAALASASALVTLEGLAIGPHSRFVLQPQGTGHPVGEPPTLRASRHYLAAPCPAAAQAQTHYPPARPASPPPARPQLGIGPHTPYIWGEPWAWQLGENDYLLGAAANYAQPQDCERQPNDCEHVMLALARYTGQGFVWHTNIRVPRAQANTSTPPMLAVFGGGAGLAFAFWVQAKLPANLSNRLELPFTNAHLRLHLAANGEATHPLHWLPALPGAMDPCLLPSGGAAVLVLPGLAAAEAPAGLYVYGPNGQLIATVSGQ